MLIQEHQVEIARRKAGQCIVGAGRLDHDPTAPGGKAANGIPGMGISGHDEHPGGFAFHALTG
ncbi:MAG: hypothetical protein PHF00_02160 [Elusimicrobia bacterium]|nr:hypothetical protein [Elusimicrobiota bacterium]